MNPKHAALIAFVLSVLPACSEQVAVTAAGSIGSTPLPCEVDAVLESNCRSCHAAEPRYGAPMALVTWEDVMAPARTDSSVTVWKMMQRRVHDPQRPMPAAQELEPDELATLDGWFGAGALKGEIACGEPGTDGGTPPPVPPPARCEQPQRFTASGDGGGFHVPVSGDNSFQCFGFRSPFAAGAQAAAFVPVIDDERVVHHYILFSSTSQPADRFECAQMPGGTTFLTGWAPGGTGTVMPDDVGMELPGTDQWLILQIHYNNVARIEDAFDQSGVEVCLAESPRPNTAVVYKLGSTDIEIPVRAVDHEVVADCPLPSQVGELHILQTAPHMHQAASSFTYSVLRGGEGAQPETILDVPRWDFNTQETHDTPVTVRGGDILRTVCRYTNTGTSPITFGEGTEDEMCLNFVVAYPAAPPDRRVCVTSRRTGR